MVDKIIRWYISACMASGVGISIVLSVTCDGQDHPVVYFSLHGFVALLCGFIDGMDTKIPAMIIFKEKDGEFGP